MRYRIDTDPFEAKQPPVAFLKELAGPMHTERPSVWNARPAAAEEVYIPGACMEKGFPDEEGLLETAYGDFAAFLTVSGAESGAFRFQTARDATMPEEAYRITVSYEGCLIQSADTEGIRRALFYIEDEMHRREGLFLPLGVMYRYAVIKRRISRGFLNPHYCPGCEGELADDTEYYTDDYLNRLAHDGVNALWVQERVRAIIPSAIIPEYGQDGQARIKRLNRLIERCRRYGIKVYLEGIEPASTFQNPDLKKHPRLLGQRFLEDEYAFCSSTEEGKAYIKESITSLFQAVPGLAGMVNISAGEAISCCASLDEPLSCPHCLKLGLSKAQVLADCEAEITRAMRSVSPEAELVSWAYSMRGWQASDADEYFAVRGPESVSMINFEDDGQAMQLGRIRTARDYWLSYTGPGELFKKAAVAGEARHTPVYAKIQVCSSHEVSTVPYVPVPGILYDKYKYMHEHGISGAMYCWYFGNYPSMMNKAAGELAFAPFFTSKEAFLSHLAGIYWGSDAKEAARAYNYFEEGYSHYPVSMTFEWHGPMGDAPVWPLHLEPVDLPVPRSYKLTNMVGSDRLGETMLMGHTYEETLTLCSVMRDQWSKGTSILSALANRDEYAKKEQQSVSRALEVLFASGTNILRFYALRNSLALFGEDKWGILQSMRGIVLEEIENSKRLADLCLSDKRLGYHCEAIGFKFFPEKLRWRVALLEELLETEFPQVEERIKQGRLPLPFYFGLSEESHRYVTKTSEPSDAVWEALQPREGCTSDARIRLAETEEAFVLQLEKSDNGAICIKPEFEIFHPHVTVMITEEGEAELVSADSYGLFGELVEQERSKWQIARTKAGGKMRYTVTLQKKDFFDAEELPPFRLAVSVEGKNAADWEPGDRFYHRLIFGVFSPDSYVFIVPGHLADMK